MSISSITLHKCTVYYAIQDAAEALAYLTNPLLSTHFIEISEALLLHAKTSVHETFGPVDAIKLKSSMTLFATVLPPNSVFHQVIENRWCYG